MRVRTRWGRVVVGALVVGTLAACSPDGPESRPAPSTEAMDQASDAASAAVQAEGAESLGAVGGDAEHLSGASVSLPFAGTIRAFAVCNGGGKMTLDVAGTPLDLDCDGAVQVVDPLVLPDRPSPLSSPTRVSGSPGGWAIAFAAS